MCFLRGTLENFTALRREAGTEIARSGQRLLVGPWAHGSAYGPYPDHHFDVFAGQDTVDLAEPQIRFFDRYLRGASDDRDREPPVRIFVMGENRWRDENEWPLSRARCTRWFLHSDGHASTAGGQLSPEPPGQQPADTTYSIRTTRPPPWAGRPRSPRCC